MNALTLSIRFDGPENSPLTTQIEFHEAYTTNETARSDELDVDHSQLVGMSSTLGEAFRTKIREFPRLQSILAAVEEGASHVNIAAAIERDVQYATAIKERITSAVLEKRHILMEKREMVASAAQVHIDDRCLLILNLWHVWKLTVLCPLPAGLTVQGSRACSCPCDQRETSRQHCTREVSATGQQSASGASRRTCVEHHERGSAVRRQLGFDCARRIR